MAQSVNTMEQKLARIKNNLQMPLVVRDLLMNNASPKTETAYALHEILSNYSAEQALLCAVFSIQEIACFEDISSNDMPFVKMECERIIERYTSRIALSEENPDLWEETQKDMVSVIAEDIEGLCDLIQLCNLSYEITNPKITAILDILEIQLQAQLVIIDEVIELLKSEKRSMALNTPESVVSGYEASNVIMFPRQ